MHQDSFEEITVSLRQAKPIFLAKAIETAQDDSVSLTSADAEAISMRVAHTLGEKPSARRFLTERATQLIASVCEKDPRQTIPNTSAMIPQGLAWVCILMALILGFGSDYLTSTNHVLNLFSIPLWSVIFWNFAVYCLLFCCAVGLVGSQFKNRFSLPLRNALTWSAERLTHKPLLKGWHAAFYGEWKHLCEPLVRRQVTKTLHLSAAAFTLGLILSLVIKGFSTSYVAAWESTWLADSPELVQWILEHTYGLVPAIAGLPSLPDAAGIAAMQADLLPYTKLPASAAPWLIRLIVLLIVFIIIPRLAFAGFNAWRARHYAQHIRLKLSDDYFRSILTEACVDVSVGSLIFITPQEFLPDDKDQLFTLQSHWDPLCTATVVSTDYYAENITVPALELDHSRVNVVAVYFDASLTPESDVHGPLIEAMKAHFSDPGTFFAVIINFTDFMHRYGAFAERFKERLTVWREFIQTYGVATYHFDDTKESQIALIKALRSDAAARSALSQNFSKDY